LVCATKFHQFAGEDKFVCCFTTSKLIKDLLINQYCSNQRIAGDGRKRSNLLRAWWIPSWFPEEDGEWNGFPSPIIVEFLSKKVLQIGGLDLIPFLNLLRRQAGQAD